MARKTVVIRRGGKTVPLVAERTKLVESFVRSLLAVGLESQAPKTITVDSYVKKLTVTPIPSGYRWEGTGRLAPILTGCIPSLGSTTMVAPTGFEPVFGRGHVFARGLAGFLIAGPTQSRRD
jgi:hypothetical protein